LDTPPEIRFDRLTRLAAHHFRVAAFVGLVDQNRIWIKSVSSGVTQKYSEFPRQGSFSGEVIRTSSPLVVADATKDPRFESNPLVKDGGLVRFFAGYPLRSPESHCVGIFALTGSEPREMDSEERAMFADFAALAEAEMNFGLLFRRRRDKEAERYKELLGEVSQRLRTPLNGILGSCDLLAETELAPEQRGFVDWLNESANLMLTELDALSKLPQVAEPAAASPNPKVNHEAPKVLVADDNPVNQVIALQQLRKIGCVAEAVPNGKAALKALELGHFDVVLMDCQMPDLDGYAATEEIRRREVGTGGRVKIIAVTANVLPGERERCIASGMDGYLPKPFHQEELEHAIFGRAEEPNTTARPIDSAQILAIQNEAPGLLKRLAELFEEAGDQAIENMATALTKRDLHGMSAAAHRLKGSAVNFGAQPLVDACEEVESSVHNEFFDKDFQKMLDMIRREYLRVIAALKSSS
jgi:CheY-like chemotaxis protein